MRRTIVLGALVAGTYFLLLRRPVMTWGATPAEASGRLPGDELLEEADGIATRAIDVDAPARAVWPWIAQMGPEPRGAARRRRSLGLRFRLPLRAARPPAAARSPPPVSPPTS